MEITQEAGSTAAQVFEGALARLWDERLDVSRLMLAAIAEGVAEYPLPDDAELLEDVYRHCVENLEMFVRTTRARRRPEPPELDFVRDVAVRRVGKFLPLDGVLHAYRAGLRAAWSWLMDATGDTLPGREAGLDLTRWSMEYVDAISQAVAEAYLRAHQRVLADADRTKRELLDDLLAGRFRLDDATRSKLTALGMEPTQGHVVIAVAPGAAGPETAERLHVALRGFGPDPLVVVRRDEVIALAPAGSGVAAVRALVEGARTVDDRAGISTVCRPLTDVPRGYDEARRALHRATRERPVVSLAEETLFEYLTSGGDLTAQALVAEGVDALLSEDRRQRGALVKTLEVYAACDLNVGRTARRLVVHPNTVQYRLNTISRVSGLRTRSLGDLIELLAGIRVRRARG